MSENSWRDIEYFDVGWKKRLRVMAAYLSGFESVLDLGCGLEWLREFLPPGMLYTGVDYVKRSENTVVCDFNKYEFPNIVADVTFVSGCLEYIDDYKWFVKKICKTSRQCIISYCVLDEIPDLTERTKLHWKNHLTRDFLLNYFDEFGMSLKFPVDFSIPKNNIFVFYRNIRL